MGSIPPLNPVQSGQTPVTQEKLAEMKIQTETNKKAVQIFNGTPSSPQPNILKRTWVKISHSAHAVIDKIQKTFQSIYSSILPIAES